MQWLEHDILDTGAEEGKGFKQTFYSRDSIVIELQEVVQFVQCDGFLLWYQYLLHSNLRSVQLQ